MSLASLLLPSSSKSSKKAKLIDTELDALFKTPQSIPPSSSTIAASSGEPSSHSSANPSKAVKTKKRKPEPEPDVPSAVSKKPKRVKITTQEGVPSESKPKKSKKGKDKERDEGKKGLKAKKKRREAETKTKKGMEVDSADDEDEDGEEDNSDLETSYYLSRQKKAPPAVAKSVPTATADDSASEVGSHDSALDVDDAQSDISMAGAPSDSDSDGDISKLLHETVTSPKKARTSRPKTKHVPQGETSEQRDLRTIFIGNLGIEVAQKKSALKQLHRYILAGIPNAKIESTRFRSIAFQSPTAKLVEGETAPSKSSSSQAPPPKSTAVDPTGSNNAHSRSRATSWRERQSGADAEDATALKKDEKQYLTPAQKKKIAFIHHEFHSSVSTINAYIVFAHSPPSTTTTTTTTDAEEPSTSTPTVMDPYEAAKRVVELFDGTMFLERMIRVDVALRGSARSKLKASSLGDVGTGGADPKLSVFVGNLDFESREEDLRVYFEGVIAAERGPPEEGVVGSDDEAEEDEEAEGDVKVKAKRPKTWVTRVRIVRDKETQLGKGFAYVQFAGRACVDEILAMEEGKLKFAKRKLRVQRCKTIPGASMPSASVSSRNAKPTKDASTSNTPKKKPVPIPIPGSVIVPKGDPALGAKLAGLSKPERKEAKSQDADRVARRLAKKKARIALGNAGVKVSGTGKDSGGKTKERKRERDRDRKAGGADKKTKSKAQTKGKGRVRSEKSISKRNVKK